MIINKIKEILSNNNNRIQLLMAESCLQDHKPNKTILFIGVFHGDEPEGEYLIEKLIKEINNNPQIIDDNRVLFIPVLNPDGKRLRTRGNANGVDLNRNFPTDNWILSEKDEYYSGPKPASEIETQFLIKIIEE
jgi:murein peptide amidase A